MDVYSSMGFGLSQTQLSESLGVECVYKAIDGGGRLDIGLAQLISETTCNSEIQAQRVFNALLSYLSPRAPDPYAIGHSDHVLILKALQVLDHALHNGSSYFEALVRQQRDTVLSRLRMYEASGDDSLRDLRLEAGAVRRLISDDGQQLDFERKHSHTTRWSARINRGVPAVPRPSLISTSLGGDGIDDASVSDTFDLSGKATPQAPTGHVGTAQPNNPRPSSAPTWSPPLHSPFASRGYTGKPTNIASSDGFSSYDLQAPPTTAGYPPKRRPLPRRTSSTEGLRDGQPIKTSYIDEMSHAEEYLEEELISGAWKSELSLLGDEVVEYIEFVQDQCQDHPGVFLDFIRAIKSDDPSHSRLQTIIPQIDHILADFPDLRLGFKQVLARKSSKNGRRRGSPSPERPGAAYQEASHETATETDQPPPPKLVGGRIYSQYDPKRYRPPNYGLLSSYQSPPETPAYPPLVVNRRRNPRRELGDGNRGSFDRDSSPSPPPGYVNPRLVVKRRRRPRPENTGEDLKEFDANLSGSTLASLPPNIEQPGDRLPQSQLVDIEAQRQPSLLHVNPIVHGNSFNPPQTRRESHAESEKKGETSVKRRQRFVSDLVRDSWMETTFPEDDVVCHVSFESNPNSRQRRVRKENRWRRCRKLGVGTYGTVWLEESQDPYPQVKLRAVKEIRKGQNECRNIDYNRELEAIAKFSHPNYVHCFVKSLGWYENENSIFITMEYHEKGDLQRYLTKRFPETEARTITSQLLEALCYMHDNGFAHRDLKPGNILVMETSPIWWVKVCDFGISKRAQEESTALRTTAIGTKYYQAPEVCGMYSPDTISEEVHEEVDDTVYGVSVDIWALGAITYYLVTKQHAFGSLQALGKYATKRQSFPIQPLGEAGASDSCKDLVRQMLAASPGSRPTASQALKHPWVEEKFISSPSEDDTTDSINPVTRNSWPTPLSEDVDSVPSNTWPTTLEK
uniref:Autophagy-related protein 1 n=2 Tax=Bionectria ochroleuca TaxID=29856 RepID=A0A0B7KB13_BIOOC